MYIHTYVHANAKDKNLFLSENCLDKVTHILQIALFVILMELSSLSCMVLESI